MAWPLIETPLEGHSELRNHLYTIDKMDDCADTVIIVKTNV